MELVQGTRNYEPQDFLSNMPDNVVTHILDRLPLQYAVRTSVLSSSWRFKWTMLSQLVLDKNFFKYLFETIGAESNFGVIISRLLLHLKGAITKFVLYIDESCYFVNEEDISHWILFLSTKGVKDLTVKKKKGANAALLKLPKHLFSCLELKHLKLGYCFFDPPTSFQGFPNLSSLEMHIVKFDTGKIGEFFTRCPVLEILNLSFTYVTWKVKLTDFAKLSKLKMLSLFLCNLDDTGSSSIFNLVCFLPKLQRLSLDFLSYTLTDDDAAAEKTFHTTFPSLKSLILTRIDFGNGILLSRVVEMIRSFLNLQTLQISATEQDTVMTQRIEFPNVDYDTRRPLQLRSLVFTNFKASVNEVGLIKYLLARSPFLKRFVIHPHSDLALGEQLTFAKELLKLQRAYPLLYIDLC